MCFIITRFAIGTTLALATLFMGACSIGPLVPAVPLNPEADRAWSECRKHESETYSTFQRLFRADPNREFKQCMVSKGYLLTGETSLSFAPP